MKLLLFLLISTCVLISCSEAPVIIEEPAGRIVLAEFFTFARCTFCPEAEHALDSLSREYGDSLAVVAYHRRVVGDTISPDYVSTRENFYGITSSPATIFDGTSGIVQNEDPSQNYSVFKGWIISDRNIAPKLRLHLEKNLVADSVNLKLHIVSVDSIENGEYRLFFILYEDSVYFAQSGAPESTFYYVTRMMIPDEQGALIDLIYPDSSVKEMVFNLQSNWDKEKLGVVAFVQDMDTKEVLQAIVTKRITSK